jgi:hypothetical protein
VAPLWHRLSSEALAWHGLNGTDELGYVSEAEDAVQDAWLRLSRTDTSAVDNLDGWLTTVSASLIRTSAIHRSDGRPPDGI